MKKQKMTFSSYRAGDFLIRLKNAARAYKSIVSLPNTKMVRAVAKCLIDEGYLLEEKVDDGTLTVKLSFDHKQPVLIDLRLVSTPGLRIYNDISELKARKSTSSILILSTPKGIISSKKAIKENVGGEVLAEIW